MATYIRLRELPIYDQQRILATGWQKIEGAPQDGSTVLLFGDLTNPDDPLQHNIAVAYWQHSPIKQWVIMGYSSTEYHPTHWMPAPFPPHA